MAEQRVYEVDGIPNDFCSSSRLIFRLRRAAKAAARPEADSRGLSPPPYSKGGPSFLCAGVDLVKQVTDGFSDELGYALVAHNRRDFGHIVAMQVEVNPMDVKRWSSWFCHEGRLVRSG
ncbi:hypothetical protein FVA81_01710 (plasmid) [Rhizobium sp. WL3]|uniref:hypothetical protein n=1 Tax=Rhizobium sp. WL3 TaxID=2603277 RepID=UPI0011C2001F|nr:hypothetical protein [Rhizobium sp. WL3]QEE43391.1 hypothetical protein FVA81_01710 [Rhizobium sp. WL3]